MTDLSFSFEDAKLAHLRDVVFNTTAEQRMQWLEEAMELGFATARARGRNGQITLDPHGKVMWSALHEKLWVEQRARPTLEQVAQLQALVDGA